jgi:hypothetical protein
MFKNFAVQSDREEKAFVTPRTQLQNSTNLVSVQRFGHLHEILQRSAS